jgi:APA family basic amino acid/polyamine antiporter
VAVVVVGALIAALAATTNIMTTWTFSAFTVLIYYAVTNLAALRLSEKERLYSTTWAWVGLLACLALAFAIEPKVWATGLCVLGVGVMWHWFRTAMRHRQEA